MNSAIPYNKLLMESLGLAEGNVNNRMLSSSKKTETRKKKKKAAAPQPKRGEYLNRSMDKKKG